MGVQKALVDRARVVTREPTATKVEGTRVYETVLGSWFRCRLMEQRSTETQPEGGPLKTVRSPEFLFSLRALDGTAVGLSADQRVEVEAPSNFTGTRLYMVQGEPEVLRRRVGNIGAGLGQLQRVEEPGGTG